jgi:hypothetical protein
MKNIFFNTQTHLRNGWWILIFIALVVLSQPIYKPLKSVVASLGANQPILELVSPILILLITWFCLRLRRQSLSNVGLKLNISWCKQLGVGFVIGCLLILITAGLIWGAGGISFSVNLQFSQNIVWLGFYGFVLGAFLEELLHRGFIFQRLIDGLGVLPAQLLIATLFTLGHWGNPGMEGETQIISSVVLFIVSLLFGLAYIKTQSLAMPIGLHLGWNWFQGTILGFSVSGHQENGLLSPIFNDSPQWLTGGEFGPEASIFSVLVGAVALTLLYFYKGRHQSLTTQTSIAIGEPEKPVL